MSEFEKDQLQNTLGLTLSDARPIVGVIHVGGCGDFTLRQLIEDLDPAQYPDWYHMAANTDAKSLRYNFVSSNERSVESFEKWKNAGALEILQLGADEVTQGFGTGADPSVGRQAALTKASQERIQKLIDRVHFLLIEGAVGGGTGTGVIPVIAHMAKKSKKPAWAIVVMPDPGEGRDDRAQPALLQIRSLVPTSSIQNSYIEEYLDEMEKQNPGSSEDKTYLDMFKLVNEKSNIKFIKIVREIVQGIGRGIHKDLNDLVAQLNKGSRPFVGVSIVKKIDAKKITAEQLRDELLRGEAQDRLIIPQGMSLGFWAVGPWGYRKVNKTRDLVMEEITKDRPDLKGKIEVFPSINFDDVGNEMWMAVLIVAPENPDDCKSVPSMANLPSLEALNEPKTASSESEEAPVQEREVPSTIPIAALSAVSSSEKAEIEKVDVLAPKPSKVEAENNITFYSDEIRRNPLVPYPLLVRFNRDYKYETDPTILGQLLDEVEKESGYRPDPPEKPVKKSFFEGLLQGVGFQKRTVSDNGGMN